MSTLATINLKNPDSASNNIVLGTDGTTTISSRVGKSSYAIIADQKTQNTGGGTFTSGAWRTRDLNTEITDPDGIVTISSNQFTLAAGSYLIRWTAPAYRVDYHQTRLYNITATTAVSVGASMYSGTAGAYAPSPSIGAARVTLSGTTVFEIQHYSSATYATSGFGLACGFGAEQYTLVEIFKEV